MAKSAAPKFQVSIKSKYEDHIVGFNNSAAPLGQRNDLDKLMQIALDSQSPSLLKLFSKIPTEQEWLDYKGEKFIEQDGGAEDDSQSTQTTQ